MNAAPQQSDQSASLPALPAPRPWLLIGVSLTLIGVLLMAGLGLEPGATPTMGAVAAAYSMLSGGLLAAAYVLGGVGLVYGLTTWLTGGVNRTAAGGAAGGAATKVNDNGRYYQLVLGFGLALWLSHLFGWMGAFARGPLLPAGVIALGLSLWAWRLVRVIRSGDITQRARVPGLMLLGVPGMVVMIVAACSPPGRLWSSEFGGFDVLSYHLQLPIEWGWRTTAAAIGASGGVGIAPLTNNVYSFLPGYGEAAYFHLHAALGGTGAGPSDAARGLIAGDGYGLIACQFLSVFGALIAAVLTGRGVWTLLGEFGHSKTNAWRRVGAAIGGAAVVSVPWVVVTGSLAYNETLVMALMAGAFLAAVDPSLTLVRRGLLCGLLVGVACGCKPTALFLGGPLIGLSLLWRLVRDGGAGGGSDGSDGSGGSGGSGAFGARGLVRSMLGVGLASVVGGMIAFAPPLLRNYQASGNPIFPAGVSVFGTGHWTAEQSARFNRAHKETAALGDKVMMLVGANSWSSVVSGGDGQPRGMLHRQFGMVFPLGLACCCVLVMMRPTRWMGVVLIGSWAAACVWWLVASHCQSRFLVPLIVPMGTAIGLAAGLCGAAHGAGGAGGAGVNLGAGAGGIFDAPPLRRLAALLVSGVVAWLGVVSVMVFLSEGREQMATGQIVARPNAALVTGVAGFTGELYRADLMTAPPAEAKAFLENCSAVLYCNLAVPRDEGLYLLGDSTPLYFVGRGPATLVYHTTWDRSPLGLGITANPKQPERWGDGLRAAGVKWVLVNIGELDRLGKSGWYDPAVNSQIVADWLRVDGELVRRWERTGQLLFRLKPATVSPALPNSASPSPSGGGA